MIVFKNKKTGKYHTHFHLKNKKYISIDTENLFDIGIFYNENPKKNIKKYFKDYNIKLDPNFFDDYEEINMNNIEDVLKRYDRKQKLKKLNNENN